MYIPRKFFLGFLAAFLLMVLTYSLWADYETQKCLSCTNGQLNLISGDMQTTGTITALSSVTSGGNLTEGYNAFSIAAGTGAPSYTISSPTKAMQDVTCADTDGCNIWLSITGASNGQRLDVANAGSNNVVVNKGTTAAMTAATVTLGANDTITFIFRNSLWTEIGASNN